MGDFVRHSKRIEKLETEILSEQKKYDKLRKDAYKEMQILEEYFGKRKTIRKHVLWEILIHLEARQKDLSYTGNRGVILGVVSSVLVYIFNTGILSELITNEVIGLWYVRFIAIIVTSSTVGAAFMILYTMGTKHFFNEERKIRNQIYINEYLIKLVKEEYDQLD